MIVSRFLKCFKSYKCLNIWAKYMQKYDRYWKHLEEMLKRRILTNTIFERSSVVLFNFMLLFRFTNKNTRQLWVVVYCCSCNCIFVWWGRASYGVAIVEIYLNIRGQKKMCVQLRHTPLQEGGYKNGDILNLQCTCLHVIYRDYQGCRLGSL